MTRTTLLLCILGLTICAYFIIAPLGVRVETIEDYLKAQAIPIYQIRILRPMSPGRKLNEWLIEHPGWRVIQISYMDHQAPWVLVERRRK